MNCVLKYPGAKNRIASWICEYIPVHKVYLELFFGSGAIFFHKQPAKIETLNDIDGDVVNYFRIIRENPEALARSLEMTPYSREEYDRAYQSLPNESEVERARKFAVRCFMGYGCGNRYHSGFRSSQCGISPRKTKIWRALPEILIEASMRLQDAQIENLPALELLARYDTKDVFIYADPPYLPGTRKSCLYQHEMTREDHIALLEALRSHPGKVLLSGRDNDLYHTMLSGWYKVQKRTQAEGGRIKIETIWMNYEPVTQMKLFDFVDNF